MVDLVITPANVVKGTGASVAQGTAGATITAGQTVYLDATTNTYKLTVTNSGTAAVRVCNGIALHAALTGQPLQVHTGGPLTVNAVLVAGRAYIASATAGGIAPIADVVTGWYTTYLGLATSTTSLAVNIQAGGVAAT